MKKLYFVLLLVACSSLSLFAQTEVKELQDVKSYDGFLLDMKLLQLSPIKLPEFTVESLYQVYTPAAHTPDFSKKFELKPLGHTFGNGTKLKTFGQYTPWGVKKYQPAVFPWERDDFHAGFQLKSADGKFSFGMHLHRY